MEMSFLQVTSDEFLNLICHQATIGLWSVHLETKEAWFSDACYDLLSLTGKEEQQDLASFLDNIVHPADRYVVTKAIKKFLFYRTTSGKAEVRLKNGQGVFHWFEIKAEARMYGNGTIEYLFGSLINIDEKKDREEETNKVSVMSDVIEEMMNIGIYERSFVTDERKWSKMVYDIFELPYGTYLSGHQVASCFMEEDRKLLLASTEDLRLLGKPIDMDGRLVTAKGNTIWVRILAKPVFNLQKAITGYRGTFQKIEQQKVKENFLIYINEKIKEQKFFLDETSSMSDVGGWEMDLERDTLFWSDQTKRIHGVDKNFVPSFDMAVSYYTPPSCEILLKHFNLLLESGKPYDLELELITQSSGTIWIRTIGKPVYHLGKIVKVRGVIQNITKQKHREIELSTALNIINGQNDKLKDFTYIVSHNLRSHAGNLKMITEMVELETDVESKIEWIDLVKNVSASLSQTVNSLNGLVNLNIESKRRLSFTETFNTIQKALNYKLLNEEVEITTDFLTCEWVDYVPAYLESIMLNLITNAIKYKHPERKPVISLHTAFEDNRPLLKVKDNGLGIDLEMYGNRIFKMNQTFHQNSDARGIGLYITKNQVEIMGGAIEVDSIVDKGSTFTVHF